MRLAILSSLAFAGVLFVSAGLAAAREPILPKKPKEIVVVGGSASKSKPKTLKGQQGTQKYYEMKLNKALVVPVSPLPSKHKGEIEVHSISPGAGPSAGPSRKRRLQAR